ncbi:serine/threonine protein kinase [Apiospora saccharicola]|uniref:Serine/threonine protein kinase n=1 Tax=Apiospora saccharicola TaxID=335842 RepID=A0ABR1W2J3_9PEZI
MAERLHRTRAPILETFKSNLESEWKYHACRLHDTNSDGCHRMNGDYGGRNTYCCTKDFYDTDKIVDWMLLSNGQPEQTNAAALLSAAQDSAPSMLNEPSRPRARDLGRNGRDCYIVFAILLNLDYGFLIDIFQRFGIIDRNLPNETLPCPDAFKLDLQRYVQDVDKLISDFDNMRFMFQRVSIELNMSAVYFDSQQGRWVSPFCRRKLINTKGGTAQVWEVSVQDRLLTRELKESLKRSEYDDPVYGKCYSMALKTFTSENKEVFNRERQNYLAVEGLAGMVQYLGEYEIEENIDAQGVVCTSNLLLEYGDFDLEELFLSKSPPTCFETTVEFWEALFKVAEAVDGIHNLRARRELGPSVNFHGWHADIKPDNILRVRGEYKLADLGFAKFRKKDENGREPSTGLIGLTETYGAPETDIKRRGRRGGTRTDYTQKIDIWSLGCVFSVAATWVILGCQGVLIYDQLRQNAIKELRESQASTIPTAADAFHDGQQVLSAVTEWHGYLRTSMRKSDTITSELLDLIDTKMLQSAPDHRLASRELVTMFAAHIAAAKDTHSIQVTRGEVAPLSDQIREAVGQVEEDAEMEGDTVFQNQTVRSRSSRAMLAHDSPQSSRRNKSELKRQAKQSMRFARNHAGASSHLSSRMDKSNLVTARQRYGAPMTELRSSPFTNSIPESPELRKEESPKASQTRAIDIDGQQCESPKVMPHSHIESHPREGRLLEKARIPELETIARTTRRAGEMPASNFSETHGIYKTEHNPPQTPPKKTDWPSQIDDKDSQYIATGSPPASSSEGPVPRIIPQNENFNMRLSSDIDSSPPYRGARVSDTTPLNEVTIPPSSFHTDPSWPIYVQLESIRKKTLFERLKGGKDETLSSFLVNRDIKFVIDNGGSMKPYWPAMRVALETLATMTGSHDKDGLDLEFTIGKSHNTSGASVSKLLRKFDKARDEALRPRDNSKTGTDMATILDQIFSKYLSNTIKPMTLIVLSDGLWEGTTSDVDVETSIVEFLKNDAIKKHSSNSRWFSIEFVSFGQAGLKKLEALDDDLEEKYKIRYRRITSTLATSSCLADARATTET